MKIKKQKKERMFKKIFCWLIFLFLLFSAIKPALSQVRPETLNLLENVAGQAGYKAPQDPVRIVIRVINFLLNLVGVFFILMIIYGGLMWMTGGATDFLWLGGAGQEEKIKKARTLIRDAIIGLAIIILSKVIYYFIVERFKEAGEEVE
ncbi:MAG: hypothetical protein N2259_03165 [Patescibacteria group bacterium]|nr:hypothetical protein [Patescibacteria group bacterium]